MSNSHIKKGGRRRPSGIQQFGDCTAMLRRYRIIDPAPPVLPSMAREVYWLRW